MRPSSVLAPGLFTCCLMLAVRPSARAVDAVTLPPAPASIDTDAPNYVEVDRWTRKNGMPHNSVTAILQARDGYLWVGTLAGVARFDGVRFLTFDERGGQLPENEIRGLAEGPDGSLWIGAHGGGISRMYQGRFTRYGKRDGLVDDFVNDLSMDPRGRLWIATDRGVSSFDGARFRTFDTASGLPEAATRTLHADPGGTVWVASWTGGLSRIDDDRVAVVMAPGKTPWSSLRAIRGEGATALYLATFDGLFRLQGGTWTRFTTADGLSSD
jgi:ligand-binding sensor domain-containing protein